MNPQLLHALLPVVTVHSHSVGVDARSAPPALFAALARYPTADVLALVTSPFPNGLDRRDPRFPPEYRQNGAGGGRLRFMWRPLFPLERSPSRR